MKLKFELTIEQANLILAALAKLPYEASADLITGLKEQATPQLGKLEKSENAVVEDAEVVG